LKEGKKINFNNIRLIPRHLSTTKSRNDVDLSIQFGKRRINLPVLNSPMDTIGGEEMCDLFSENGLLGCYPKLTKYKEFLEDNIVSVGLCEYQNIDDLYGEGIDYFLIDVANDFNSNIEPTIQYLKEKKDPLFIITGNVASAEGYKYLADLGVDAVRVGIGVGSMCVTTNNTGIGQGIVSSIMECYEASLEMENPPLIIADGGIKEVGDIAKALAVGADLVMTGSLFSGCKETPGKIIIHNGEKYKVYQGSASYAAQSSRNNSTKYIEGEEMLIKYKGSAQKVIDSIDAGLRSAFSYMGASNVEEFKHNCLDCVKFV